MIFLSASSLRSYLLDRVIPFWFRHGVDHEFGGVLSAMDEAGRRQSEVKYLWSQGRWLWVTAALYNRIDQRPEFLEAADATAEFLLRHGRDAEGRWLFAVSRRGEPVEGHTSIYSDCFAIYGLSEYFRARRDPAALEAALATLDRVMLRVEDPAFRETAPETLPPARRPHAVPMILLETVSEMIETLAWGTDAVTMARLEKAAKTYAGHIMDSFVRLEWGGALVELLDREYRVLDPPEGSAVVPGHAIESMWFVMRWARRRGMDDIVEWAAELVRRHLELGWDPEFGGLLLGVDARGPEYAARVANADKKMWWPHTEALYAILAARQWCGAAWCDQWMERVAVWSIRHFEMPEEGEWRQRLDRQGRPITDLIALPVKDPFHLPRALILMIELLESR